VTAERNAGGFIPESGSADGPQDLVVEPPVSSITAHHDQEPATIAPTARKEEAREPTPLDAEGSAVRPRPVVAVPTSEADPPKGPPVLRPSQSTVSDAGSLPLEDPDDSDADPDWLVDAT
jgi:xeroderma pigmentosum group C-complementing protein